MLKGQINTEIRDEHGNIIPWKKRNPERANISRRARMKRRSLENPKREKEYRTRWALQHKYGITPEIKKILVDEQGGVCLICSSPISWETCATDHCHIGNYIRGMLCKPCNSALGLFKDDPNILRKAAEYLEQSKEIEKEPTSEDFEIALILLEKANGKNERPISLQSNPST